MLLMGKLTISMAIFNSYVKLPEGNINGIPGLVNIQKAIENGHRNSGFTPSNMVIFHSYVNVYQRVQYEFNTHDGS